MPHNPRMRYVRVDRKSSPQAKAGFFVLLFCLLALVVSFSSARERLAQEQKPATLPAALDESVGE